MAITTTTLSGAITATQTVFGVASVTGITAPNNQTGAGIILLRVDQELMLVTAAPIGTSLQNMVRGFNGTPAAAHVSGALVQIGNPSDFGITQEQWTNAVVTLLTVASYNHPGINLTGSADTIDPTVPGVYVVKTAGVDAMTLAAPPVSAEGNIIEIWSDTTNAHTLTATSLIAAGVALKSVATFPAFRGAGLILRACNGVWHLLGGGGDATNGGPVVLT